MLNWKLHNFLARWVLTFFNILKIWKVEFGKLQRWILKCEGGNESVNDVTNIFLVLDETNLFNGSNFNRSGFPLVLSIVLNYCWGLKLGKRSILGKGEDYFKSFVTYFEDVMNFKIYSSLQKHFWTNQTTTIMFPEIQKTIFCYW